MNEIFWNKKIIINDIKYFLFIKKILKIINV